MVQLPYILGANVAIVRMGKILGIMVSLSFVVFCLLWFYKIVKFVIVERWLKEVPHLFNTGSA